VTWSFFLGEFLGVLFIFAGFLVSIEVFSDVRLPFTRVVLVRRHPEKSGSSSGVGKDEEGGAPRPGSDVVDSPVRSA
jgi:hypothetical protein